MAFFSSFSFVLGSDFMKNTTIETSAKIVYKRPKNTPTVDEPQSIRRFCFRFLRDSKSFVFKIDPMFNHKKNNVAAQIMLNSTAQMTKNGRISSKKSVKFFNVSKHIGVNSFAKVISDEFSAPLKSIKLIKLRKSLQICNKVDDV